MKLHPLLLSIGLVSTSLMAKDYPIGGEASKTVEESSKKAEKVTTLPKPSQETEVKKEDVIETAGTQKGNASASTLTAENDAASTTALSTGAAAKDMPAADTKATSDTKPAGEGTMTQTGGATTPAADAKTTGVVDSKDAAKAGASKADDDVQKALAKIRGGKDGDDKDEDEEEVRYGGRKRYESFNARTLKPSRNISDSPSRRSFGVTK